MNCTVPMCEKRARARGWCNSHYERWRKHGDLMAERPVGRFVTACRVCPRPVNSHGYCRPHWERVVRYGDPRAEIPLKGDRKLCSVVGCERPHRANGLCSTHNHRRRTTGEPGEAFSTAPCPVCGGPVDRSLRASRRYCSQPCRWESVSGNPSWRKIARRDGMDCYLCGETIDPAAPLRSALSPTTDHVVPRSLGGTHDMDNLRLAHLACNVSKGDRPLAEALARLRGAA